MESLYLIAGLGNPGSEYSLTRHNAGFLAVERLGREFGAEWKFESRFQAHLARVNVGGDKIVLCKPETYMNRSGQALAPLAMFYKIPIERVLVIVDDADLPFGQIRLRPEGSSGGHHGLDSVEQHFGTCGFARLRIGIGRTERGLREITGHVLGRFAPEERELLDKVLDRCTAQVKCYLSAGIQKAMSLYNGAVVAPAKKEEK